MLALMWRISKKAVRLLWQWLSPWSLLTLHPKMQMPTTYTNASCAACKESYLSLPAEEVGCGLQSWGKPDSNTKATVASKAQRFLVDNRMLCSRYGLEPSCDVSEHVDSLEQCKSVARVRLVNESKTLLKDKKFLQLQDTTVKLGKGLDEILVV